MYSVLSPDMLQASNAISELSSPRDGALHVPGGAGGLPLHELLHGDERGRDDPVHGQLRGLGDRLHQLQGLRRLRGPREPEVQECSGQQELQAELHPR